MSECQKCLATPCQCAFADAVIAAEKKSELALATGSERMMWRLSWRISTKPVKVIMLGGDQIKVVGSCRISQSLDERHESYHDTYKDAMLRFLANAQRDVNDAKKELANAQRHLKTVNAKWMSYCASSNEGAKP